MSRKHYFGKGDLAMLKADLRKKYLAKRTVLSQDEVFVLSEQIFENFTARFPVSAGQKIHLFLPIEKFSEVQTRFFAEYFWKQQAEVFVPRIENGSMVSVSYTASSAIELSAWGIPEPLGPAVASQNFDIVFTPLLYADAQGNRVGYGKGFYDAFFAAQPNNPVKIGLSFFPPEEAIDDVANTDVKIDYLVTPLAVLSFGNTSISTK